MIRLATSDDNQALVALAAHCPMEGDVGLCIDREPNFFALNDLEGDDVRVGVADNEHGVPVGCISVATRNSYINGEETQTLYVSDLKVHPDFRGKGVADELSEWARDQCIELGGESLPILATVLAGNDSMERRLKGPRGLPSLVKFATLRSFSISFLWHRKFAHPGIPIAKAAASDIDEMMSLWNSIGSKRQFTTVYDATSFGKWIERAPGLEISDYLLARDNSGRLLGFMGIWDQATFKQTRVTSYSLKLSAFRFLFNLIGPLLGATTLPKAGQRLCNLTVTNLCADDPIVLRSLIVRAYNDYCHRGYSFLSVGLDVSDPLTAALKGLLAQTTDVWACLAESGADASALLNDYPFHHEIALV